MRKYRITSESGTFYAKSNNCKYVMGEADDYFKNNESITVSFGDEPRCFRIGGRWYRLEAVR
jgi:hypothetical protein